MLKEQFLLAYVAPSVDAFSQRFNGKMREAAVKRFVDRFSTNNHWASIFVLQAISAMPSLFQRLNAEVLIAVSHDRNKEPLRLESFKLNNDADLDDETSETLTILFQQLGANFFHLFFKGCASLSSVTERVDELEEAIRVYVKKHYEHDSYMSDMNVISLFSEVLEQFFEYDEECDNSRFLRNVRLASDIKRKLELPVIASNCSKAVSQFLDKLQYISKVTDKNVTEETVWAAIAATPSAMAELARNNSTFSGLVFPKNVVTLLQNVSDNVDSRLYGSGDEDGKSWFDHNKPKLSSLLLNKEASIVLNGLLRKSGNESIFDGTRLLEHLSRYSDADTDTLKTTSDIFARLNETRKESALRSKRIRAMLDEQIVGQASAKDALIDRLRAVLKEDGTVIPGPIFFYGASGAGKTQLAKVFVDAVNTEYSDNFQLDIFNMEQFCNERDNAQLFGSGSQYNVAVLGALTTPQEFATRRVIVFDEIEKANETVIQSLLTLLAEGKCKDFTTNRELDFSQTIIIFNSNVGQEVAVNHSLKSIDHASALSEKFSPEFINRIRAGHICLFKPLVAQDMQQFLQQRVQSYVSKSEFSFDDKVADAMLLMAGDASPRAIQGQLSKLESIIEKYIDQALLECDDDFTHTQVAFTLPTTYQSISTFLEKFFARCWEVDREVSFLVDNETLSITIAISEPRLSILHEHVSKPYMSIIENVETRFDDIIGQESSIEHIKTTLQCLKEGQHSGDGILLSGPPGTGKTLLARATANAFDGVFCHVNASDLTVGDADKNIKELFDIAKKYRPSIIFLDEIDSIAMDRKQAGMRNVMSVNTLLTQLDGFNKEANDVLVMAATNNVEMIDDAAKRPGRLGTIIPIGLPTQDTVQHYLQQHVSGAGITCNERVLEKVAYLLSGEPIAKTTAFLHHILLVKDRYVGNIERLMVEACITLLRGEKRDKKCSEAGLKNTAYHEAGHAVAAGLLTGWENIICADINPRQGSDGAVSVMNSSLGETVASVKAQLQVLMAGRAAELLLTQDPNLLSLGAGCDISRATKIAKDVLARHGMSSDLGIIDHSLFDDKQKDVQKEVEVWLNEANQRVTSLLEQHWDFVEKIAASLLEQKFLTGHEIENAIEKLIQGKPNKCAA